VDALSSTMLALFVLLAALGAAAFVVAWTAARVARSRAERRQATGRTRRPWGGRYYGRVSTKYFEKERKARAARARQRAAVEDALTGGAGPGPDADRPPARPPGDPETLHRATLGLGSTPLTAEAVRKAYVQRIQEYHPDRVATLGEKIRRLAEDETKRINEAYRFLRGRYGF
jgi:hypothetical protein